MKELSLFTGAGGGILGTHLLGWEAIGYVEFNTYCQRVIAARIADGILNPAPIFGDVREFVLSGAAAEYRGFTDVVTGGFPCQPFSVAGRRAGSDDSRNMWPSTIAVIRAVRPAFAFLENVPGLLSSGYFGTIVQDLAESGYDVRWRILSAAELGAPHIRKRLWIVAHANGAGWWGDGPQRQEDQRASQPAWHGDQRDVADTTIPRDGGLEQGHQRGQRQRQSGDGSGQDALVHPNGAGRQEQRWPQPNGTQLPASQCPSWWEVEPDVCRVVDGLPNRVDRLRALGNAQVSGVAAAAWRLLTQDF